MFVPSELKCSGCHFEHYAFCAGTVSPLACARLCDFEQDDRPRLMGMAPSYAAASASVNAFMRACPSCMFDGSVFLTQRV